jgi:signal transduction protein with GAF and PtsI domain
MPEWSVFFKIVIMLCRAGDARKIVTFVPNCQLFRTKVQLFIQNSLPRARAHTKQQQQQQQQSAMHSEMVACEFS